MNRIYEIIAILLLCLAGLALSDSFVMPVIVFIYGTAMVMAARSFTGRWPCYVLVVVACATCGPVPLEFCMVPLFVYTALWEERWYLALPSLLALRLAGATPGATVSEGAGIIISGFDITAPISGAQYLIAVVGTVIAMILYLRVYSLVEANDKLRALRDEVAGMNETLRQQNQKLLSAQDSEIEAATLRERNRIAREIHDHVGHMLTRSLLQVGAMMVAHRGEAVEPELGTLRDTLDQAMTNVRESVHDLHDDSIDLRAVIYESADTARERFDVDVDYGIESVMPEEVKLCFAGVAKEAVSNAIHHSDGDSLHITVCEYAGYYELVVRDNGSGQVEETAGIGLTSMRERVRELQGRLVVDSRDAGFTVTATVPK